MTLYLVTILVASITAAATTPIQGNVLNAREFGAMGDGKTDDTTSLQKALNVAGSDPGAGRTVFLPSGQYKISRPLIVPLNVDLIGHGVGFSSALMPVNSDGLHLVGAEQTGGFSFRNKIQGITINMQASPKDKAAILLDKAYTIKLSELFIYNAGVGIRIRSSRHITLEDLSIYGKGRGDAVGVEVTDTIVNAYNIDIESVSHGLIIRESRPGLNSVSLFGGYIERFGSIGILIDGATGTNLFGTVVIGQLDNNQTPVVIQRGTSPASACSGNYVIGGSYGFEGGVKKKSPILVSRDCPNNTITSDLLNK